MTATNPPGRPAMSTAGFGGSTADQVLTIVLVAIVLYALGLSLLLVTID